MTSITDGHPQLWPRDLPYTVYTHDRTSPATTQALLNEWERFRLTDGWNGVSTVAYASAGNANIGSSHFPPTCPEPARITAISTFQPGNDTSIQ